MRRSASARRFDEQGLAMSAFGDLAPLAPYVLLILAGFLPNEVWRMLGVVLARGLDEESQIIVLARAVATAILTGVVGKLVIFAPGALATVPVGVRIGAAVLGVAAFMLLRRSVFAGVATATAAIVVGVLAFGG
jgi:branched-subunit amino acid transport protein AzlD